MDIALRLQETFGSDSKLGGFKAWETEESGSKIGMDSDTELSKVGTPTSTSRSSFSRSGGLYSDGDGSDEEEGEWGDNGRERHEDGATVSSAKRRKLKKAVDNLSPHGASQSPRSKVKRKLSGDGGYGAADPTDPNYFYESAQ